MKWFANTRIAPRIIAGFMLVALLSGVCGAAGYAALRTSTQWMAPAIVAGALVLTIALAMLIARSISHPLCRLADTVAVIARGDASAVLDLDRRDELGVLADSLQAMVSTLHDQKDAADEAAREAANAEARTRQQAERLDQAVTRLIDELSPVAEGDLTARPRISTEAGDIAVVADFTGLLIASFAAVARNVRAAATQAQVNSAGLSARVQELLREVEERTDQVNGTAIVATGIASSANDVLATVEQVGRATHEAVTSVAEGDAAVARTLEHMDAVRATMIGATRQIKKLSDSSVAMNNTVGLVLQFAGDLEILADNAQIEAAHHSDAGSVFTAVAEQTGRLAEDAQKALVEIQGAVLANRQETAAVGRQMEQVAAEVVASARAVEAARAAFTGITLTVRELDGFVDRVNGVALAQVEVAARVGTAMEQIVAFFRQTADEVRLAEMDAAELRQTIEGLRASIANLRLDDAPASRAA